MLERLKALQIELVAATAAGEDAAAIVELDQSRMGRLSRMDALQAQAMSKASEQRRELMLRRVGAAIVRIENDSYGYCRTCEKEIPIKRLEFDPTAMLCIECASNSENS